MDRFCAFLRGVNVNGTSMKMVDVVDVFQKSGMKDVVSVLATGNIIFSSDKESTELKSILERKIGTHFNYECFLFIKKKEDILNIVKENPFENDVNFHVYYFVTETGNAKILMDEFQKCPSSKDEEAYLKQDHFYWKVKKGNTLDSEFGKILGKKNFKSLFTSRNMNTIEKIIKK